MECLVLTIDRIYKEALDNRYYGFYQFNKPTLLIKDTELIKQVTVKDFDHFCDHRSFVPADIDPIWGNNLFELKGEKWRHMRPAISPSFTSSKMKFIFESMSVCAENFVKSVKNDKKDIIQLAVRDALGKYSNDVIASVAFGVTVDSIKDSNNEFFRIAKEATNLTSTRTQLAFFSALILPKAIIKLLGIRLFTTKVSNFFSGVVNETVKIRKEQGIIRPDLIHILLSAEKDMNEGGINGKDNITNADILSQAVIFLVGGLDSVSKLLQFMCYELAVNKNIQDRLRAEILLTKDADEGKMTYDSLNKMKYLDMVISETLRKYPVMSATDRICTKRYVIQPVDPTEKPLVIEKGSLLWIPIYSLHNDPKKFENPDHFDPERFSDENKDKIDPYAYIPFGAGPRNCIGARFSILNVKALIFHLLMSFELLPTKQNPGPLKYHKRSAFITPDEDISLKLRQLNE
ncbi:hypothetical protein JTB14_007454 [Gonioctena quinquepunctata]|nr:hypothetical protein JTB14_007454 [Gonioctena quinquepunctata]